MRVCDMCFHLCAGRTGRTLGEWLPREQLLEIERLSQRLVNERAYLCGVEEACCDLGAIKLRCNGS
eukprot:2835117-Pyramimonas_sp.AAC.1